MAAAKNNLNALGNKGGGRPSAYKELANAEELNQMWSKEFNVKKLKRKIKSGNYSMKEKFLLDGLEGNTRILVGVFNKVFPDNLNLYHHSYLKTIDVGGQTDEKIRKLFGPKKPDDPKNKNIPCCLGS